LEYKLPVEGLDEIPIVLFRCAKHWLGRGKVEARV
jgi:hypothetical protein